MKARTIRYIAPRQVDIIEQQVSDPQPGEIQLRGLTCGICAWDIATYKYGSNPASPTPPGHEGVGVITKLGKGVTGLKEGQRVCGGGFGEYLNVPVADIYPLPESKLADEFWTVEPVACVVNGMDRNEVRVGDNVAIIGCGFMGLMFLQVFAHSPINELIAIDVDASKLELSRKLGATQVYNPADKNFPEIEARLTNMGIDHIEDCTGLEKGLELATRLVRNAGMIDLFGWNRQKITVDADAWQKKGIAIINATPSGKVRNSFPAAIRLLHRGIVDLKPLISHVIGLDEYPAFLGKLAESKSGYIKGVVRLSK